MRARGVIGHAHVGDDHRVDAELCCSVDRVAPQRELAGRRKRVDREPQQLLLAVNTFPPAGKFALWRDAIDGAAKLGVDAVIVADMGVADYAARTHPDLRLHLSVQAGASSVSYT